MHRQRLADYRRAFEKAEGQIGALFAVNGEAMGFDLFDSKHTLGKLLPKLVESYALDAIDHQGVDAPDATADAAAGLITEAAQAEAEAAAASVSAATAAINVPWASISTGSSPAWGRSSTTGR